MQSRSMGELRRDWWKLYGDPVVNWLIEQAMTANPGLQAAAERFVQAHDVMIQARSKYLPRVGMDSVPHIIGSPSINYCVRPTVRFS